MNQFMQIDVELPKKRTLRFNQIHRRITKKGFPMLVPLKKDSINHDDYAVIKRYKTERFEENNYRVDNEFIQFNKDHQSCSGTLRPKRQVNLISLFGQLKQQSLRDSSIKIRKSFLPKLQPFRRQLKDKEHKHEYINNKGHSFASSNEIFTFYPNKNQ